MKEATGELNMTVITVVAIAAVGAFFYAFVWPAIQNRLEANTICSTASPGLVQIAGDGDEPEVNGDIICETVVGNKFKCKYKQNDKTGTVTCQFNDAVPGQGE